MGCRCCCFRGTTTAVTLEPKSSHHTTLSFTHHTHHTRTYAHTRAHQSSRYITLAWYNIFDCRRHWQLLLIFAQYKAASPPSACCLPACHTFRGIVGQLLDLPCGACGRGVMGTNCITLHINSALRHALSPTRSSPVSSVFLAILVYLCLKKFQLLLRNGTWNDVGASNCCAQWNWAEAILFALFLQATVPTVRPLLVLQIKQMVLHPCGLWHILFAYQIKRSKTIQFIPSGFSI